MPARDEILTRLRTALQRPELRFPPPETRRLTADERMTVGRAEGDRWALARRFGEELAALHGTYEIVETVAEARMAAIGRLQAWLAEELAARHTERPEQPGDRAVVIWAAEELPIDGLTPALADLEFQLIEPQNLHDPDERTRVRHARAGITGVDAAFAATGTVVLGAGSHKSRAASLTPFRHLLLVPISRIYPSAEAWMAKMRQDGTLTDFLRESRNVALVSGPSKSADLEGILTMGVHGPKIVHAVIFDDIEAMIRGY
ncbi:MAG: LUD domain-containing protein [Chloroflexi bacterium]|nr:LUD domain-containing protein [Chloroflexota bacterium]